MNFNVQPNRGAPPNQPFQVPLQQPFLVGNTNIATNMIQQPNPFMMMGGMAPGFANPYPFPPPMMDNQPAADATSDKSKENQGQSAGLQPHLTQQGAGPFTNGPNQPIGNLNPMPASFGFPPPMMPQPTIITAPPTVIPQPAMQNLMGNPTIMAPPIINQPIMSPPMMNNNATQSKKGSGGKNKGNAPPVMSFPMKPLIDSLLNPVVVTVPEKDDTPKLTNVVYVGGLTNDTTNEFVINILQRCGKTIHFKRHTDPSSGLLATFAFCDFESPGGAYYAIECLADLDYGENKLKVSCNSRVRCQIDDWKEIKIEELCAKHIDKTREEVIKDFEAGKAKLRAEFVELINLRFKTQSAEQEAREAEADAELDEPEPEETPKSAPREAREKPKEEVSVLTKDYVIHKKESDRIFKLRQKRRGYDEKYKEALPAWEREEEKMLKKLKGLMTVPPSKRDRLIQDDLNGKSKPSLKHRAKEIEEDEKDEHEEAEETKSKKISMKIAVIAPRATDADAAQPEPGEPAKRQKLDSATGSSARDKVVNLFATEVEEVKKRVLSEEEIWSMVPTTDLLDYPLDWDVLFSTNLSILIEPWIRRCILEYMGDEESLVNDVLEFIFSRLRERPRPQELLFDVEQFLDEESQGFVTQLWRLLVFHQIRLKSQ